MSDGIGLPYRGRTADGKPFLIEQSRVQIVDSSGHKDATRWVEIPDSWLREWLLRWLSLEGGGWSGGTMRNRAYATQHLSRVTAGKSLSAPDVWGRFFEETSHSNLRESSIRGYSSILMDFWDWSRDEGVIRPSEHRIIEDRYSTEFRGYTRRHRQHRGDESKYSVSVLEGFFRALRMELEAVEQAIRLDDANNELDPDSGIMLFPLLMALDQGLRSTELNEMLYGDVGRRPDRLYVHGRAKGDGWLPIMPYSQRAWKAAVTWMRRYRSAPIAEDEAALVRAKLNHKRSTTEVNQSVRAANIDRFLRSYFYPKYFREEVDGISVLSYVNPNTLLHEPVDTGFRQLRHFAITAFAEIESDPEAVRRFARHKDLQTTLNNYIILTPEKRRWIAATRLGPLAEKVRMQVEGRIASKEELENAERVGALVPTGGACGAALEGDLSCQRASDCRVCEHFLIDIRKRRFFEDSAKRHEEMAEVARRDGGFKRDPENLLNLAALDWAIIRMIDEREAGLI